MTFTPARRSALKQALLCCAALTSLASTLTGLPANAADKVLRV